MCYSLDLGSVWFFFLEPLAETNIVMIMHYGWEGGQADRFYLKGIESSPTKVWFSGECDKFEFLQIYSLIVVISLKYSWDIIFVILHEPNVFLVWKRKVEKIFDHVQTFGVISIFAVCLCLWQSQRIWEGVWTCSIQILGLEHALVSL